ncbi:ammonium transporter [Colletotrichum asianum]
MASSIASCSARELKTQLAKVAVPPTAVVGVAHTIKCGDHLVSEETGEDVANVTADAMNREDVESVVNTEEILVFDGVMDRRLRFAVLAPLNANHPNQIRTVPSTINNGLCGLKCGAYFFFVTASPRKRPEAAGNVNGTRAGEVVEAKVVEPATGVPFPTNVVQQRRKSMLGQRRPRSSIAPAKIIAVAVTKRMSGISELAKDGEARMLWNTPSDKSPKIGFDTLD